MLVAAATPLNLSVGFANADDERSSLRPIHSAPVVTPDPVAPPRTQWPRHLDKRPRPLCLR
jgi:hypothetical protein